MKKIQIWKIWFFIFTFNSFLTAETLNDAIAQGWEFNYKKSLKILKNLPSNDTVKRHLAWAYLKTGDYAQASEVFLSIEQPDYEILFGIGFSYFLQKNYAKADSYFGKCLGVNKNCAAAEYFRGEIKTIQELFADAEKLYRNTLKLDYNFPEARLKLARIYYTSKKYDDSFREYSSILNIDPKLKEALRQKQNLLTLITKKPEEIVPPKRISDGSVVSPASSPEKILLLHIGILTNVDEINLWSESGIDVISAGSIVVSSPPGELLTVNISSDIFRGRKIIIKPKINPPWRTTIIVRDIKYAGGYAWAGISDREYRGFFEMNFSAGGFSIINIVNVEEYLYSVLPSEMISWWPAEALKAQAVISRSTALFRKNYSKPHKKDNFDLCDDQHCQVYKGVKQETLSARKAVDATRGEILEYNGKIAHTLYSSNCSGHTQSSKDLKGWGDVPYWCGVVDVEIDFPDDLTKLDKWLKHPPDIFCAPSKYTYYAESRWMRVITQDELSEQLNRAYNVGGIKKIIPVKRSKSGHINHLVIEGTKGNAEIEKENLIRRLVLGRLRSTNFIVEGYGRSSGVPEYFIFWGAGWGHAVGLCQSGAAGMAEKGFKYPEILKKYYKNTYIKKMEY